MYLSTTLALIGSVRLASAHPLSARGVTSFSAGSSWDILLNKGDSPVNIKQAVNQNFHAIDIDLFDTDQPTIADLKTNKLVICYFSAGSREDWRPDASDFKDGDTGKGLDGWAGENWLNVKSENVRNIMKTRIKMAADKGCTAVDPDNVDGFGDNQDGFGYDKSVYADYVKFLAQEAKANNLAIGLKNALDIIPDVIDVVQFAVNEQCHQYNECDQYKPFTSANKAVFNIEYGGHSCNAPAGVTLSTLIKPDDEALNTLGGACSGNGAPPNPSNTQQQPTPTAAPSNSGVIPTPTKTSAPQPTPTTPDNEDEGDGSPTTTARAKPTKGWKWHHRPTGVPHGWNHNGGKY